MTLGVADLADDTERLRVMNVEYTEAGDRTVVHLFCRRPNGKFRHVEVEGHHPSFYIREKEYSKRVKNHYAVYKTEKYDDEGNRYKTLDGEPLVRIYTGLPSQVADMRDLFEKTYEADVLYDKRFLIDTGILTGVEIDTSGAERDPWVKGDYRVDIGAVEPLSRGATPRVKPKKVVLDIEVAGEQGVPDTEKTDYPISTIVAWDSESEEYVGWLLKADEHTWPEGHAEHYASKADLDDLRVFEDESRMLYDFHDWVADQRPDIITGWYSNDFDIPYLINRSRDLNTYNYQDWSPIGEVFLTKYEPVAKGVSCIDMLAAYKKTKYRELKNKGLGDVGEKEGVGSKKENDMSHTQMWKRKPVEFLKYNRRDVELVHLIDDESEATALLDNLRDVVGCSYSAPVGGNIDMMDMLFLRKAQERAIGLPTATRPEVGYYYGAYVYPPEPGVHNHVVYPDYSSLYPNIMYQCNISPETLVGTEEDLRESEWSEEDCVWSYVDMTTPPSVKEEQEAREEDMEKLYFLKPSIKEGFVRSVLDDVMGLADQYEGGMYDAVKRVRNSSYGVMGDSDSYGRGFRLFDWRLAEAITLGGQRVLKAGAEKFVEEVDSPEARIVGGDTDSYMTTIPNATSGQDALEKARDAVDAVNDWLNEFAVEEFGLEEVGDARLELEIESYASGLFFKARDEGRADTGIKKRYAQLEEWNDEDGWLDEPEISITGFEYVRSDVAEITAEVQKEVFTALLKRDDAEEYVKEYVREVLTGIIEGDIDENKIGIPFGIGQALHEYGTSDRSAQAQYAGAKYANQFIYGGEAISEGDKPMYYYIEEGKTGQGMRKTYKTHTGEDGQYVHAISVHDAADLPEGCRIDRPKMARKTVTDNLESIFRTLGWGTEWMHRAIEEATPPEWYRSEGQSGLEQYEGSMDAAEFM